MSDVSGRLKKRLNYKNNIQQRPVINLLTFLNNLYPRNLSQYFEVNARSKRFIIVVDA